MTYEELQEARIQDAKMAIQRFLEWMGGPVLSEALEEALPQWKDYTLRSAVWQLIEEEVCEWDKNGRLVLSNE